MSADLEPAGASDELLRKGVRNRSQFAVDIHRQDSDADDPFPACGEKGRDARFKNCYLPSLINFGRWSLCDNPECFGDERGIEAATEGSR